MISLDSDTDYRSLYITEHEDSIAAASQKSKTYFMALEGEEDEYKNTLEQLKTQFGQMDTREIQVIPGRSISVFCNSKIAEMEFFSYFEGNFGVSDYLAICKKFEAVFLKGVPKISMSDKNVARRFILFVKFWLLRSMKLIITI